MIGEMSSMVTYALPRHTQPARSPSLSRFSLRTLFIGVTLFCGAMALYSGGYMHGAADERRQNVASEGLMQEMIILRGWWSVDHPGEPLPAELPSREVPRD